MRLFELGEFMRPANRTCIQQLQSDMNWHAFVLTHCWPLRFYVLQHNPDLSFGAALLNLSLARVTTSSRRRRGGPSGGTVFISISISIGIIIVRLLLSVAMPITAVCVGVLAPASVAVPGHYSNSQSRCLFRFVYAIRYEEDLARRLEVSYLV